MVRIEQRKHRVNAKCSKCGSAKTVSCNFELGDIDALMQLCPDCFGDVLTARIRQFQLAEGNPDCFAKSENYCDQRLCKFRQLCLQMERKS